MLFGAGGNDHSVVVRAAEGRGAAVHGYGPQEIVDTQFAEMMGVLTGQLYGPASNNAQRN